MSDPLEELAADLSAAHGAAEEIAGQSPLALRAVETAAGMRWYLCAFEGPRFLCLTDSLAAEQSIRRTREAAAASLLWERAEQILDPDALRQLAEAAGRVLARASELEAVGEALEQVAQRALELVAWRDAPERVLASLIELERGARLHERLRVAYGRFVTATDPLVAVQDTLPGEQVDALRGVEQAAGRAGVGESLAKRLGAAMADCDEGAVQVVEAHLTRLVE